MNAAGLQHRFTLAFALAATVLLAPLAAQAQITFRSAASAAVQGSGFRAAASAASGISFVGGGAQTARETSGSITPAFPSGTQAGDFAILIIAGRPTDTTEPTTPTGWTHRSTHLREIGANDLRVTTYFMVLAGGDTAPSITLPASWVGSSSGMSGQIAVWRGVNTTTPWDVPDVEGEAAAASTWAPPGITTVTNGALVISLVATSDDNDLDLSSSQGFTERLSGTSYDTTTGGDHAIGLAEKIQSASGSVTNPTWQQDANSSDPWVSITFALRPGSTSLTIAKPTGTAQNDVMIASIGFRPNTATITPPSGWTLVGSRINCTLDLNYTSLAVYRKTAGSSEPSSYTWTFGGASDLTGGIQSFIGVDTTTPVDVTGGQAIASTSYPSYAAPSVTTTVANTMVVTSHTFSSSGTSGSTWSAPSGMTESFDIASLPGPTDAGQSIAAYRVPQAGAGATGTKTATANSAADCGAAHILALRLVTTGLTINKPAGTVNGDFMVAAIGVQDDAATITPPSGWTLVRRVDQSSGTDNSLAVYTKAAGASEPASYTWSISNFTHAAGGIQTFSGVDTANTPVNVESGQATSSDVDHDAPSITPTVANTMLVTAHTFASSRTWTAPSGMTEAYDTASLTPSNAEGQSIVGSYQPHVFLATGVRTATVGGNSDTGNAHILALRPLPVTGLAGGFNAYDTTTTPSTAATGFIRTKVAGISVSLAIVALNMPRTAVETTFTGTVRVELLDASNNTGALDVNGCRSTWTVIQTLSPDPAFVAGDLGRKTLTGAYSNSYPDLRVRISHPATLPTRIGCSNDNFALRPNTFASYSVTDGDWQTAGTTRTLNNTTIPGGTVHKAGRPFTVRATAVDGAGLPATTTNYTGTPTATLSDCGGSSACPSSQGAVTLGSSFVSGVLTASTATYDEVGSYSMQLRDTTFASVDSGDGTPGDCTSGGRYICSSTISVGRFVPDNFAISLNTPAFGTACGSFTYLGQPFNYTTAPVITVTARAFGGATTTLYAGSLWQITSASLSGKTYTAANGTLDTSGITGTDPAIASVGSGVGTLTFRTPSFFVPGTGFLFTRSTPVAPFDADISLAINLNNDADGVAIYASNPARFAQATAGNGIAFSSGKSQRFGRLTIRNANGSQLLPLLVRMEAQYWPGAPTNAFITNTADSCTTIAVSNPAMSGFTGNLSACETANTSVSTFSSGRSTLLLAAPGGTNSGSVNLTVNLGASASGTTCTTVGGGTVSAAGANQLHLQGNWSGGAYDVNPTARATFGISRGAEEVVFVRENF